MIAISWEYCRRVISFLKEWVNFPEDAFSGSLEKTMAYIKGGISFLIKKNVFTKEEMKRIALKYHGIILHNELFETQAKG